MPSRKVADAHILFSAEGLKSLEGEAKGSIDRILGMLSGAETKTSQGPFSKGLLRDISLMKDMNRQVARLIAQQRALHRSPSGTPAANNVRSAMMGDRESQLSRTKSFSDLQLSRRSQEAASVSPTLLKANRDAMQSRRSTILEMQSSLADFGVNSDQLSIAKGGFNKSRGTANFIAENIKGVGVGGTSDGMRMAAQEFRDIVDNVVMPDTKDASSKELNSFISKIRVMADELDKTAQSAEEYNAALRISRKLTPDEKSGIRGNLRDIDAASQRREASLGRQSNRDFLAANPSELMGRRIGEIESNEQLSDIGKSQEISLAAQEIAAALRKAATGVREAKIDDAMRLAAKRLSAGDITKEQFRSDVARNQAGKQGISNAEDTLFDADFRSRNEGLGQGEVTQQAELDALRTRSIEIDKLIKNDKTLSAAEKERLTTEQKLLSSAVTLKDAEFKLSKEMSRKEEKIRSLTASRSGLSIKEAKGIELTKRERNELKSLNAQLEIEFASLNKLKNAQNGVNGRLHEGAQTSRRFNFMMQQASYGVQDFVQVIGQTGLSGALRASANNMASLAAATGTTGGALIGALGTIAMIGLADAVKSLGIEAETTEEKMEKLASSIDRMARARKMSREVSEEILGAGQSDFRARIGSIRKSISNAGDSAAESTDASRKGEALARSVFEASEFSPEAGFWRERGDAMVDVFGKIWSTAKTQFTFDIKRIVKEKREEDSGSAREGSAMRELARQGTGLRGTNIEERRGSHREIEREYERIKSMIVNADLSTTEGQLNLAEALGTDAKLVQDARNEIEKAQNELDNEKARQAKLFKNLQISIGNYVNETVSLMKFKSFDQGAAQATSLTSDISAARDRIDVAQDRVDNTIGTENEAAQAALSNEKAILNELLNAFKTITHEALKLPSGLTKFSTSLQGVRSSLADKLQMLSNAGVLTPEMHKRLVEQSIRSAGALAEGHSGKASREFGENQKQANDRARAEIAASRGAGGGPLDAVYDMVLSKMDEFESEFMKIKPDRSGISGSFASRIDTFEQRKEDREKVLGPDAQFDKENMSETMRRISDSIMSFSGKVERKLGETQEEANDREKKRLDDLIDQVRRSADQDDDSLIPFFELTKRKIGDADKRDLQADTSTVGIESLHSTIQNSLKGDDKEFDLQKEQRDLLQQINDGIQAFAGLDGAADSNMIASNTAIDEAAIADVIDINTVGTHAEQQAAVDFFNSSGSEEATSDALQVLESLTSNVNTNSDVQAEKANAESVKYQQASSETLSEMLTFFKRRANSGGLVIS